MDQDLYDYAGRRADSLYGGNFSAYVIGLIERDRSLTESRRAFHDLESKVLQIIEPYGGRLAKSNAACDFEIPKLDVVIEACSRFPRERPLEYRLLSGLQKVALRSPNTRLVVVFPSEVTKPEKERFRQLETAGIENLRVCDLSELDKYLSSLAQAGTEALEDALLDQEKTSIRAKAQNPES